MKIRVLGILVSNRVKEAIEVQNLLTKYGCIIKTRLGLHEVGNSCARNGLIIIELTGDENEWRKLQDELSVIEGVDIQNMDFQYND